MVKLNKKGSAAVETALCMPIIIIMIMALTGIASLCVRGEIASLSAYRAARLEKVFQGTLVEGELYAMLTPEFTGPIDVRWQMADGSIRTSNWELGEARVAIDGTRLLSSISKARIERGSSVVPALQKNLPNKILHGGDTPSPYCNYGSGYSLCSYDQ